jgi:hypothetical protein
MNLETFNDWLHDQLARPGVLAGAVRTPDQSIQAQSFSPRFTEEGLRAICQLLLDAFEVVQGHRLPHGRMRWVFQGAALHGVRRADGALLVLLVDPSAAAAELDAIEALLEQFKIMQ